MNKIPSARPLQILTALCNLPTAPYREQAVVAWLLTWAQAHSKQICVTRDRVGNLFLEYSRGPKSKSPLIIEAHMDHPGFIVKKSFASGKVICAFRGNVRPDLCKNAHAKFWHDGQWVPAKVLRVNADAAERITEATLQLTASPVFLPKDTLGMWDLPDASIQNNLFRARVCDDLGGVAAIISLLEELIAKKARAHMIGLLSRAEEVGFAGVLAVCETRGIPQNSPVIGLETSKALPNARQGDGAIIRVGDRTSIFSSGLTAFITAAATSLASEDKSFRFQRKLMDGGTCNSSAFLAYGYDSAALCVPLGNYHNQHLPGEAGYGEVPTAGPGIGSETVHVHDFAGMVRILVRVVETIRTYRPGMGVLQKRLHAIHRKEQVALLRAPWKADGQHV